MLSKDALCLFLCFPSALNFVRNQVFEYDLNVLVQPLAALAVPHTEIPTDDILPLRR